LWRDNQTYAGNWNISGGTLSLNINSLGSGAVTLNGVTTAITGTQTLANNFTTSGTTFFSPTNTGNGLTLTGSLSGTNNLVLFNFHGGSSRTDTTVRLAGTTSFASGSTFRFGGITNLDTTGNLATVSNVNVLGILKWNVAESVTSLFSNRASTLGSQLVQNVTGTTTLSGEYRLNNGAGADGANLQVDAITGGTLALTGKVTDSASTTIRALTKIGAGTMILSANTNDYRGGTTVSAGTLLANNTSGSATGTGAVAVSGTGTILGGTGKIAPTGIAGISVSTGAFIAPGASIGTLTVDLSGTTGTIAIASGAGFQFELGTANLTIGSIAGGSSDLLALAGAAAADFAFNGNNVDFLNTGAVGYYKLFSTSLADASTWTGLTFDGTTGVVSSGLTYSNLASGPTSGEFIVGTSSNGGAVGDIYFRAIPEPAAALLGGLGMLTLLRRRRA
jgi:MYXO-CTERM domain-containing protein